MYTLAYTLAFMLLSGLDVVFSKNTHSGMVHYTHHVHRRALSHDNVTGVRGEGELSHIPDSRCGPVALRCYEPVLSYVDDDGEFCGWKQINTFMALPEICMDIRELSEMKWESVLKYTYKYFKICDKIKTFQQCVKNNEVCGKDITMSEKLMPLQNAFCNNIQAYLSVTNCFNAWNSSVNWDKLMYTDWRIVQACPAKHYRQLAFNSIKLFLFSYITFPSSVTDAVVKSVNAEAAGRYICQSIQLNLCYDERANEVCSGFLTLRASENYIDKELISYCYKLALNAGKCNAFVKMNCTLNLTTGSMMAKVDFQDITNVYNVTYWHSVSNSEVDILLHTVNKGIGHCDASNLIFKQLGCFHQYMTQLDINHANKGSYLSEYMCSNIRVYNSCFDAYINSSCPDEAKQFQGIGSFVQMQCSILTVANKNISCPLVAIYSLTMFQDIAWFNQIMRLLRHYISVINYTQMNRAPEGWREVMNYNAVNMIRYYKSFLIKGEKLSFAVNYRKAVISTVCDQEAADVYNDYVTLSTGEQYYQLVSHLIKGFEYIKYLVQQKG